MKTHYSISELLEMNLEKFPKTNRAILYKVEREKWSFIEASCQGGKNGKRREYAPPPEVLKLIQAKKLNEVLGGLSDLPAPLSSYEEKGGEEAGLPSPDVRGGQLTIGVADGSTEQQRLCESARRGVLSAVERVMAESGVSKEAAMTTVLTQAKMPGFEHIAKLFSLAADGRGGGGKLPSVRTIKRWFAARESNSLAPKSRTEDMNVPSWLPVFLECYRLPMKPSVSEAYRLFVNRLEALPSPQPSPTGRGGDVPSIHQVRRWLGKLGNVERERGRRGARDLKNILPHKRRDFLHLKPAAIYTADGHTFDAEVLNPLSGLPFRPEITTVLDVGTRRCMGWSVGLTVRTDGEGKGNMPLREAVKLIRGSDVAIEFHTNAAAAKTATGIEALSTPKNKRWCQVLSKAVAKKLENQNAAWRDWGNSQAAVDGSEGAR